MSGVTATEIFRKISGIQNELIELRAMLANLDLPDSTLPGQEKRARTGWRYVRGETSGTYTRDPDGTDRLPAGYDPTQHSAHPATV